MSEAFIRRAAAHDTDFLVNLYVSTQRWLAQIGSDQWARNTEERTRFKIAESIAKGDCWLAELRTKIVGMITVDEYADPEFWAPQDNPTDALYVHRMVVDRLEAGKGVGGNLLDWAEGLAATKHRTWLRLDAWRTNAGLHAYYEQQGFVLVRVVNLSHRGSGALFQRRVRPGMAGPPTR